MKKEYPLKMNKNARKKTSFNAITRNTRRKTSLLERTFITAAAEGNVELLQEMLRMHENSCVRWKDADLNTALHVAAKNNQADACALLIAAGVQIDARNREKESALSLAVEAGAVNAAKVLLDHKADTTVESHDVPLLHVAAKLQSISLLKLLLAAGVPVDTRRGAYDGETALHLCAENGFVGGVSLLLEYKATVDARNSMRLTPIMYAASIANGHDPQQHFTDNHLRVMEMLLDAGADKEATDLLQRNVIGVALDGKNEDGDCTNPVAIARIRKMMDEQYIRKISRLIHTGGDKPLPLPRRRP